MPVVKAFRGILYNSSHARIGDVIAPPYDVISPAQQAELYDRHPLNVIRLILGREPDRYDSAAQYFAEWRAQGVLQTDQSPCMYLLSQRFHVLGSVDVDRRGFVVACALEDLGEGSVFPHEKTLAKPKEDRLRLFQSTGAMFSQIFSLYSDPDHSLDQYFTQGMKDVPDIDLEFEQVHHRLWRISDARMIRPVIEFLRAQPVFVADGHHRYETALLYRDEQRLKNPDHSGQESYNFVPMYLTNMNDPGLVVLPTHRLIHGIAAFDQHVFVRQLEKCFIFEIHDSAERMLKSLSSQRSQSFGLVLNDPLRYFIIKLKDQGGVQPPGVPRVVSQLDVTVLHSLILKDILHMTEEDQAKKLYLEYEKDANSAVDAVRNGNAQAAFLMNAPRVDQVRAVAEAGYTMPQKSTFFYPKLLSGLINYSFRED